MGFGYQLEAYRGGWSCDETESCGAPVCMVMVGGMGSGSDVTTGIVASCWRSRGRRPRRVGRACGAWERRVTGNRSTQYVGYGPWLFKALEKVARTVDGQRDEAGEGQ